MHLCMETEWDTVFLKKSKPNRYQVREKKTPEDPMPVINIAGLDQPDKFQNVDVYHEKGPTL